MCIVNLDIAITHIGYSHEQNSQMKATAQQPSQYSPPSMAPLTEKHKMGGKKDSIRHKGSEEHNNIGCDHKSSHGGGNKI